jgi:hypothetical protein
MSADHVVRETSRLQDHRSRKESGRGCYVNNPYATSSYHAAPLPPVPYHPTYNTNDLLRSGANPQPIADQPQGMVSVRPHLLPSMPLQARPPQLNPGPPPSLPSLATRPQALKSLRSTAGPQAAPFAPSRSHAPYAMIAHKFDSQRYVVPREVELAAGDVVVVGGDRGMNLGVVERLFSKAPHYKIENNVVRIASDAECEALRQQRIDEEMVRVDVQQLADNLATKMNIRGIEYQFDRQKMTIFYSAPDVHVDFRRLQRVLYSRYGCRIWIKDFKENGDISASRTESRQPPTVNVVAHPPATPRGDTKRRKSTGDEETQ